MGYAHGRKWNDEDIKEEISNVANALNLDRMPTNKECLKATNSYALSNVISKNGGFYYWGKKMNMKLKTSETLVGLEYENLFNEEMIKNGYESIVTSMKFPYDVLVGRGTKIDIKISKGYEDKKTSFYFTFNLETKMPRCDFYVFYCVNKRMNKRMIIPSSLLTGQTQLAVGLKSKYDKYIDRLDLIHDHVKYIESLGAI